MDPFNIKNYLKTKLAEDIVYNGVPIRAIVTRKSKSQFSVQTLNNPVYTYPVVIEVDADDVLNPVANRASGDVVEVKTIKGKTETLRVAEKLSFEPMSNSFKLGLS
jgi:hypothetical protein